jgi:hypothetical protein
MSRYRTWLEIQKYSAAARERFCAYIRCFASDARIASGCNGFDPAAKVQRQML